MLKAKIKSYEGKISTNFHHDCMPNEDSHCICLSVIFIASALKIGKNYYRYIFLGECKHIVKKKIRN